MAQGLREAGVRAALLVDRCPHCIDTLRANGFEDEDGAELVCGDVNADVDYAAWRGRVDLVCGGPPCQPYSTGGFHRGAEDARDGWPAAVRAVREARPAGFLFENVAQFAVGARFAQTRERVLTALAEQGYEVRVAVDDSARHGVPQRRRRAFVVGARRDAMRGRPLVLPGDAAAETPPPPPPPPLGAFLAARLPQPPLVEADASDEDVARGHVLCPTPARAYGPKHSPSDALGLAKTLVAGVHGVPGGANAVAFPDGSMRHFTVREAAELQGFPAWYRFPRARSRALHQIGNAVTVPVARAYAEALLRCIAPPEGATAPSSSRRVRRRSDSSAA